jgi:hypothetical protein
MNNASTLVSILMRIDGKFNRIITSAAAVKIKHRAVVIFIELHCGKMLLKKVMLNTHPERSRKPKTNTIIMDIHKIIRNERDNPNEFPFTPGICSEVLPDIINCMYFKIIYYSAKTK